MPSDTRIVVFGGSGFVGTHLASRLKELDLPFKIGDLKPSSTFPAMGTICDVRDQDSLREILHEAGSIINLAAIHHDDVRPISRYYETNLGGARNVCQSARLANIQTLIFTSSTAVYGSHPFPVDEDGPFEPFDPYGESKWMAESVYRAWAEEDSSRSLVIIRPTVIFGEGNRGNVYNLINQVASGRFVMVGSGTNRKSMAYVANVADVLVHALALGPGIHVFNYVDEPDMEMNVLVALIHQALGRGRPGAIRIPFPLAMAGGRLLDVLAKAMGRTLPISSIRVQKFCANTQFIAARISASGFTPRFSLEQSLVQTIQKEFGSV